MINFELFQAS